MTIHLVIRENNFIELILPDGKRRIGRAKWQDNNNLSRTLLNEIDEILRRNKVGVDPAPISQLENKQGASSKYLKLANHGAGRKGWAIRPAHRGKNKRRTWYGVDKISGYKIISDVPRGWTSERIAKITFESLMIAGLAR